MSTEIQFLNVNQLLPYPDEKLRFRPLGDEHYDTLRESIKKNGIMEPLIVTPLDNNQFTILSGHNRLNIAKELNINVPCIVKTDLSESEKQLIVIETNLLNRNIDEMLISELSYALSTRYKLLKHQGKSKKKGLDEADTSAAKVGTEYKLSAAMVKRYVQVSNLIDDLMKLADEHQLPFMAAYNISFLSNNDQKSLYAYIYKNELKCTIKQSAELKEANSCTDEILDKVFTNTPRSGSDRLNKTEFLQYIPKEYSSIDVRDIIIKALKAYFENQ